MSKYRQIRELIQKNAGTYNAQGWVFTAEVTSVSGDLCNVKIGDFELSEIRLNAIENGSKNGILIKPAIGSKITVLDMSNGKFRDLQAIGFSEVESIIIMNGGNGGLVRSEIVYNKINALENQVNDILNKLKAVVIPLAPSGTYALSVDFGAMLPLSPVTGKTDFENDKVVH